MRAHFVIACALLAGTGFASGCSGGGAGPAAPTFDPFGTEPAGGVDETPPSSGGGGQGQTIAQLCATDCSRIAQACPSAAAYDCASSCAAGAQMYPNCEALYQSFLACVATAALTCTSTGSVQISACEAATYAYETCVTAGAMGASAPAP